MYTLSSIHSQTLTLILPPPYPLPAMLEPYLQAHTYLINSTLSTLKPLHCHHHPPYPLLAMLEAAEEAQRDIAWVNFRLTHR